MAGVPSSVTVSGAGSSEVNGTYVFKPGKHENRHWGTIAGHYQHTQYPEIFIAFQDCGKNHQRPEWNKWMIISKIGVLYAAHTGGKIGVPPREGVWENVEGWGNPGAPGGKHPAPTVYHPADATTQTQQQLNTDRSSTIASGENILVSEHSLSKYNGIYTIQTNEINGKPWYKNNSGCILYFYNANSGGGPSWSLDDRSQDGTNDWFRGGWIEPPNSDGPPLGTRTWKDAGTIIMESVPISDEDDNDLTPLKTGWYRMEHADGSLIERVRVHRDERKTGATNEFIATGDLTGDVLWYVEGHTVKVPKFDSTGKIQADGNIAWGRDGNKAIYEGNASNPSTGNQSIRNDGGKIALKSIHGKYLSAQPDGRAEWNRTVASDWEFFELGERDGRKITLKSAHGKYVSAQPDGTVQINRDHAPPTGWEEFTVETRPGSIPGDAHDFVNLKSVHGKYLSAQADGTAQWNREHAPPGGWEDIQFVPQGTQKQESAPIGREESIEILEAVAGKPVRFRINNPPNSNDAWVGIYHPSSSDREIGKQKQQWEWLRDLDVNNASLSEKYEGNWSIRVFSDGGYRLHERKDFAVEPKHVVTERARARPNKRLVITAFVIGVIMFGIGLPLFIGGNVGSGEETLGMVIPGAILFGVGAVVAGVASFVLISSWSKSYAESRKAPPKWPKIATVCAALLLIPGASLLIIGLISSGTIHHENTASALLRISDTDGLGDQGFIIFIEGTPGDFDSNGIHDYCEAVVVSAHHSGSWMSDPWTATAKWNEANATRQAFELEIAHPGSGCSADVWPEQKGGNLVKIGRACYGCMAGYTDISATNDFSYEIPMWIQDGEKVVESTGTWIAGSIMLGISVLSLVGLGIIRSSLRESMTARKDPETSTIEVLAATEGKPVRFRINDPPSGRSAWVGIYPSAAEDQDHGEEGERWKWLRDMNLKRASFPEKSEGRWSIRVFSDGGFTLDERVDFDILPEKERWWED